MRQIDSLKSSPSYRVIAEEAREQVSDLRDETSPLSQALEMPSSQVQGAPSESFVDGPVVGAGSFLPRYLDPGAAIEAIILERMRPPYLIRNDEIEITGEFDAVDVIRANKAALERKAKSVGRIDLLHHATHDFVGTGWVIDTNLVVTNRHVASLFAAANRVGGYDFLPGSNEELLEAQIDFVRQHRTSGIHRRAFVTDVVYIAGQREPDFAFLTIQGNDSLEPLQLRTEPVRSGMAVAAVGYPAWDGDRNDPGWMQDLFGGVYNVKRFSPGFITKAADDGIILLADYTSLGGNSGSVVCDLEKGDAVGLHFAGVFRQANYMVSADVVDAARRKIKTMVPVGDVLPQETRTSPAGEFADRKGYNPDFLGDGPCSVPLPGLGSWEDKVAPVAGSDDGILRYEHFSVVQCAPRRLPLLTAVNIDGRIQRKLDREGDWRLDGRLDAEHQIGNELYARNPLDRGHMVRRRDPGWGEEDVAKRAEGDTFHYTNAVPQHEDLNQRTWVGLEDYILEAAETRGFKASVFTGPVFRDTDRHLKHQPGAEGVAIPEEFWKVVVMVDAKTGRLHATAYALSHGPLIRNLTEAPFLYGQYKTFQVPLALIEQETGLAFGSLRSFDPLNGGQESFSVVEITAPSDMVLTQGVPAHA